MKLNKSKIVAILALTGLMACGPMANAQDTNAPVQPANPPAGGPGGAGGPPGGGRRGGPFMAIAQKLNLTDDQKPKFQEALKAFQDVRPTLRNLTPEERTAKLKEVFAGIDDKLKTILTPEQFTTWTTESAQIRTGRGGRGGRGPGGPGGPGGGAPPQGAPGGDAPKSSN